MKAVIYSRISKAEQSEFSLEAQVESCRAWIEREGYELYTVYTDNGFSAKNTNRPQLQQMLADLKQRKFGMIVIWRLDRLTRDTIDGLNMVKNEFKPNGVDFASVNEDIDTSTPDGYMMFTIRLSIAQNEREKIAERVMLGMKARARKGLRPNASVPYGYNLRQDLSLEINEEEAEVVRRIYDLYLEGNGINRIANILTEDMIMTKNGRVIWGDNVVLNILTSPTYYGANRMKVKGSEEDIIVRDMHEGIVSENLFNEVQNIAQRKRDKKMTFSSYDFPFATILKCGECGSNYYGQQRPTNRGGISRYYRCRSNTKKKECPASTISEPKLYALFRHFLDQFEFSTNDPQTSLYGKDIAKEIKRLNKAIDESSGKKKNYTRAMGSGKLEYEMFLELMSEENEKIEKWKSELDKLDKLVPNTNRTKGDVTKLLNELKNTWDDRTHKERKIIVQRLFDAIVIKKEDDTWSIIGFKLTD